MKKILPALIVATLFISSCSKKDDMPATDTLPAAAAPLSAGFVIVDQDQVKEGLIAQFRNASVSAVSYRWDFGTADPADVSTQREPTFIFPGCGPKTVTLTATDAAGHQKSFSIQLEVHCTGKHAQAH